MKCQCTLFQFSIHARSMNARSSFSPDDPDLPHRLEDQRTVLLQPGTRVLQSVPVLSHRLEHERAVLLQLRGAPQVLLQLRGVTRGRSFKSYTLHGPSDGYMAAPACGI